MAEKITVYKLTANGNWCAYKKLGEALEYMAGEIEAELEEARKGDESSSFKIVVSEMTPDEFDNLPEFDGF